jgi:hypothetical protein
MPAIPGGGPVSPSVTPSTSVGAQPSSTPSITPSVSVSISPFTSPSVTPSITKTPTATPSMTPSLFCESSNLLEISQAAALQYLRITVDYYKINLNETKRNMYGESLEKWFYEPISVRCTIDRSPDSLKDEMFGPDITKSLKLSLPKLVWDSGTINGIDGVNVLPEIGDIIRDLSTDRFYEIHNIVTNYTPLFNTHNITQLAMCPNHDLIIYEMECYQTRVSKLNLLPYKLQ